MAVDGIALQLLTTLMEGSTTYMSSPGSEVVASLLESFGGLPQRIPGGTSDLNLKLGTLAITKGIAVYGDEGISFKISAAGDALPAHPFAYLGNNVAAGMGISEIWVSNSDQEEHQIVVVAWE